jgi:hypothetical protein
MSHLVEPFHALGFDDSQTDDFLTILSIAGQEKAGHNIELPSHESNLQSWVLIEEAAHQIKIEQKLSELQSKGLAIDHALKQELIQQDDLEVKELLVLNELCQKVLMRPAGTERQQLTDNDSLEQHRFLITTALANLGFINEIKPKNKNPDTLLVLGASQITVTERLYYIGEEGVKPKSIYLLGGQRPLWAVHEPVTAELVAERIYEQKENVKPLSALRGQVETDFNERAAKVTDRTNTTQINAFRDSVINYYHDVYHIKWPTELDMMIRVVEKAELQNKFRIIAVDTPMQPDEYGKLTKRPITKDTINSFKENYAKQIQVGNNKISVLAVSSQPHVHYQEEVIEEILVEDEFNIEVVGKGVDLKKYKIREVFDALARAIFAGLGNALKKFI